MDCLLGLQNVNYTSDIFKFKIKYFQFTIVLKREKATVAAVAIIILLSKFG